MSDGTRIRYFARLHGYKQPGYNIGTCCEGQGTRLFGQLPEYLFSLTEDGSGDLLVVNLDLNPNPDRDPNPSPNPSPNPNPKL